MTVPLEEILEDLPPERREKVEQRAQQLADCNQRLIQLRSILRYEEHQDKPIKEKDGSETIPRPRYTVYLGALPVASIQGLPPVFKESAPQPNILDLERYIKEKDEIATKEWFAQLQQHLTRVRQCDYWRAFFRNSTQTSACIDDTGLDNVKDQLELDILEWLDQMQVSPQSKTTDS